MSGVQDIKLIADTAVFSIISICLTPYSDVGAHSRTSCLGLRTNQAYLHMVPSKWPIPQNHSPNGFSVFEFRIKFQLFNYHIYSVALAYLQMHCRQYSFVDWVFLNTQFTTITGAIRQESWKSKCLSVKSLLPLVYFVHKLSILEVTRK